MLKKIISIVTISFVVVYKKGYDLGRKKHREELKVLKEKLVALEAKYQELLPLLGEKNCQVRMLADEISKLRRELGIEENIS